MVPHDAGHPGGAGSGAARSLEEEVAALTDVFRSLTGHAERHGQEPSADQPPRATHETAGPAATEGAAGHCASCGCGAPVVCSVCPVCRAATALQQVSPHALDQLADLATMIADSLRLAAQARSERTTPGPQEE